MTRTVSRSLLSLAAVLLFPVLASAQATHTATPAAKPAVAAHPATPPVVKSAAAPTPTPAARAASATAAAAAPSPAAATAKPATAAAGPARDARGRFIAKSATPAAGNHATCKDGSSWSGAQRSGACARHGGVKAWN